MPDLLDTIRAEIDTRLDELRLLLGSGPYPSRFIAWTIRASSSACSPGATRTSGANA
jgi:hypothetical protein